MQRGVNRGRERKGLREGKIEEGIECLSEQEWVNGVCWEGGGCIVEMEEEGAEESAQKESRL